MNRTILSPLGVTAALSLALASCVGQSPSDLAPDTTPPEKFHEDPTKDPAQAPGAAVGGEKNTFNHFSDLGDFGGRDPFDILAQRQEEGPPEVRTRLHSCQKIQYGTLRNILIGFGVNMDAESDPPSAGQLWKGGAGALGAANYDARVGETITWSSAGAAKLFDIFVQAAPEIIANLPMVDQCKVDGTGPAMFDDQNHCNADAVTCLIGRPASAEHVDICNSMVKAASDVETGKKIAVATMLAAAHSCE
jgi:hypothetical protein